MGLTVAEEGDALLVIARTSPAVAPPNGQAMFILSAYGLDDAALEELESRWTGWWGSSETAADADPGAALDSSPDASPDEVPSPDR